MKKLILWAIADKYGRIYQSACSKKLATTLKNQLNIKNTKVIKLEGIYK